MSPQRTYYENGKLRIERWYIRGQLHRDGGPAWQDWDVNSQLRFEQWLIHGKHHRLDGPAWREWGPDGQLTRGAWCIEGKAVKEVEPIDDPLDWALWVAKNFGNVHGLEKFCLDNLDKKAARAILASARII